MVAIGGVIVLFVTLVILGGFFLYKSLPSGNDDAAVPESAGTTADPRSEAVETGVLYIRVTGDSSDVVVRVPGGDVLADTTLKTDEYLSFEDSQPMDVTIQDPGEVEVYVHGERRDVSGEEAGYNFSVQP
ncbi:RodZ domain-containing protein [Streptomonospora algeriensis]|uniref:RodZ domain-containing protein n=1 Tax=Streptomonospora algeriensis TaxID=995084 RepID=A0ABW3BJ35_9ACTN